MAKHRGAGKPNLRQRPRRLCLRRHHFPGLGRVWARLCPTNRSTPPLLPPQWAGWEGGKGVLELVREWGWGLDWAVGERGPTYDDWFPPQYLFSGLPLFSAPSAAQMNLVFLEVGSTFPAALVFELRFRGQALVSLTCSSPFFPNSVLIHMDI